MLGTHNKYEEDHCEENGNASNNWNYNRKHHQHGARENTTLLDVRAGGQDACYCVVRVARASVRVVCRQ